MDAIAVSPSDILLSKIDECLSLKQLDREGPGGLGLDNPGDGGDVKHPSVLGGLRMRTPAAS